MQLTPEKVVLLLELGHRRRRVLLENLSEDSMILVGILSTGATTARRKGHRVRRIRLLIRHFSSRFLLASSRYCRVV